MSLPADDKNIRTAETLLIDRSVFKKILSKVVIKIDQNHYQS